MSTTNKLQITEKPLITIKTLKRKHFEQVPQEHLKEGTLELPGECLGVVNQYALLCRLPNGNHCWVHENDYLTNHHMNGGQEGLKAAQERIRDLPRLYLD